jgi:hypothetical protein
VIMVLQQFIRPKSLPARKQGPFSRSKELWVVVALAIVIGALAGSAFYPQIYGNLGSDIQAHLMVSQSINAGGPWNLYSVYFLLVAALSFGSKDLYVLGLAGDIVLILSVIAKGVLSYFVLRTATLRHWLAAAVTVGLVLAMPFPNWWKPEEIYLDKIAPNLWFNSTFIFTMPFAVLLFFSSLEWLKTQNWRTYAFLGVWTLLSALSKPNWVLALFPVLGAIVLIRTVTRRNAESFRALWLYIALVLFLGGVLYIQYLDVFGGPPSPDPAQNSHIIFAPFAVWSLYTPNIPASLLLSIPFPLAVVVLYFREVRKDLRVIGAWAILAVALAQYLLLAESGQEFYYGNWGWASNIAMYLVFLASAAVWLSRPASWRYNLAAAIFILHIGAGIFHYSRVVLGIGVY